VYSDRGFPVVRVSGRKFFKYLLPCVWEVIMYPLIVITDVKIWCTF
jgi:hypothetical protein